MQVTLNALPASLAEFQNLPRNTPEEVVAGFLCALHLYTKNPNEGVEAMNLLRGPRPMTPYDGQFLRDRLRGKEYLTTAYFAGATPQNSYTPTQPYSEHCRGRERRTAAYSDPSQHPDLFLACHGLSSRSPGVIKGPFPMIAKKESFTEKGGLRKEAASVK